jgi:hypothetical protein
LQKKLKQPTLLKMLESLEGEEEEKEEEEEGEGKDVL